MDSRAKLVYWRCLRNCRRNVQIVGAQVEKAEKKRQWANTSSALARRHRRSRLLGPVESRIAGGVSGFECANQPCKSPGAPMGRCSTAPLHDPTVALLSCLVAQH